MNGIYTNTLNKIRGAESQYCDANYDPNNMWEDVTTGKSSPLC